MKQDSIHLENRILQALLVAMVGILTYFLVAMFDRFENQITKIEDENKERDAKLAELVLNIEKRLVTLESR